MPDSQVRALRPHTKSKGGCKACKVRKVKCSETRPACASCLRRNEKCEYDTAFGLRFRHMEMEGTSSPVPSSSTTPPAYGSVSPSAPYSSVEDFSSRIVVESTERRLLEMRLMHHFTSQTVHSGFLSTHDEHILQMWWKTAPALAFKHPFLLNIIISIAALHITRLHPEQTDMADNHRIYFNAAISQLRRAVHELSPENAEAIIISHILIALPSFILLQNTEVRTYSPPLQLFSLLASNIPLWQAAIPLIPPSSSVMSFATAKPDMSEFRDTMRNDLYRQQFAPLISWRAIGEVINEESQDGYDFALCFVGRIIANIEDGVDSTQLRRMLYSFPSLAPAVFVQRLRERNPRALVILAYYFSLSKAMDNVWWMRGIAEREVFGIQSVLPEEWQWAMSWPLQKIAYYAASSMPHLPHQ